MASTNHDFNDDHIAQKVESAGMDVLGRDLAVTVNFDAPASNAIETATVVVTRSYRVRGSDARDLLRDSM